jgi:hypothetical protein
LLNVLLQIANKLGLSTKKKKKEIPALSLCACVCNPLWLLGNGSANIFPLQPGWGFSDETVKYGREFYGTSTQE